MNNPLSSKSKTPLQFKVFHTLLGFAVFFSLITIPAEAQQIEIFGLSMGSEFLWWPFVFFFLKLIHRVYGLAYYRQAVYLVIAFHAVYILFLKFAIWLPASSFWKLQSTYTQVLGRDFLYIAKSSLILGGSILLPMRFLAHGNGKQSSYLFLVSLTLFSILNMFFLNFHEVTNEFQLTLTLLIFAFLNIFYQKLTNLIVKVEQIERSKERHSFKFHHILFCSSIVFFIASKTMAAKFISIGFLTINVGGIVFSLAYLTADMMTDVYGIERTKQMILFVIFCNLLFVFDVWITNLLAKNGETPFKAILHNQAKMFIASGTAFFLGMTINSTVISLIKARQRRRGISLKKAFVISLWTRIATSSALGIIIDVSLFSLVAFYGIVPSEKLGNIIVFEDAYKISYEFLLAPVSILLIYFLKIKEKVDIYDELSNLNPFKINLDYNMTANKFVENYIPPEGKHDG